MPAYKDQKRNTWYVKFRYKDWQNQQRWAAKRGFPTKREALQWEQEFRQRQAGDLDMPFRDFIKVYSEDRTPRLKESTVAMKENIIDTKLLPYFGEKKLREITSADVIQWQNELLKYRNPKTGKPFSSVYLKTVHNQLSAIFNHAVRHYQLSANPARLAGNMGKESESEMQFWTKEEYLRFSEEMMDTPPAYYCFEVLYWCGIREGELLALTREDFNFKRKELSITKTFQHIKGKDLITTPKTPQSVRKVLMPDFLCDELQEYFGMCYDLHPTERVFPLTKNSLARNLQRGAERAELPCIRVHDLRHSHVSLLIDWGYSAVAIAKRVGHKSIDITFRYAHLFPSVQTQMMEQLNQAKGGNDCVAEKS